MLEHQKLAKFAEFLLQECARQSDPFLGARVLSLLRLIVGLRHSVFCGVLLVFGASCQRNLRAGQEHGRTIPLPDLLHPAPRDPSPVHCYGAERPLRTVTCVCCPICFGALSAKAPCESAMPAARSTCLAIDLPGPDVSIRLHDRKLYTKLFINPELYAAEAYMDGTLTLENGAQSMTSCCCSRSIARGFIRTAHRS